MKKFIIVGLLLPLLAGCQSREQVKADVCLIHPYLPSCSSPSAAAHSGDKAPSKGWSLFKRIIQPTPAATQTPGQSASNSAAATPVALPTTSGSWTTVTPLSR